MNRFLAVMLALGAVSCSRAKEETSPAAEVAREKIRLVEMKPEAQEHIGLQTAAVRMEELAEYLQVTGTVQPIDTRIAHVRSLARGRVLEVLVRVGDRVAAGQPLARFDNIEAGELLAQYDGARSELAKLRTQHELTMKQAERNRRLTEIGAVPQKEYETSQSEAQSAQQNVQTQESVVAGIVSRLQRFGVGPARPTPASSAIGAPFAGVVIKAQTAPGEVIGADQELFSVADLSHVWVQAEVYEKDLARVQIGQQAYVTVDTYPDQKFSAKVTYLGDILDPQTRTARVRCELANPDSKMKLDMFAAVAVPTNSSRRALAVPASSIQQVDGRNVVFVRKSPTQFEVREVTTGITVNDLVEIQNGVAAGDVIVKQGSFHLKSVALGSQIGEE